jgi:hypothetical protein
MSTFRISAIAALILCGTFVPMLFSRTAAVPKVELKRVPGGGIQPQVAVEPNGTIHLVYFRGDPAEGDIFYTRSKDGENFSPPIQVNSVPAAAVALGNIRGARIAVGRSGNVFVVWNGSRKLGNPALGRSPMLFSRLNANRTAFEPERNLIHTAYGIDGGGGVAADQQGRVYVFWHAPIPGRKGEEFRRVWMTRSADDARSFEPERIAWDAPTGACGCCSLNAFADQKGAVYVLFRSAQETVHRDMYLLESSDHGSTFTGSDISKWNVGYCVMSSEALASGTAGTYGAWETEKQVHFGPIDPAKPVASDSAVSVTGADQKYPSLALNRNGLLLVAWTEGMRWKLGGSLHWQIFHKSERIGESGSADGVPAWSLVAAYSRPSGDFVVLY